MSFINISFEHTPQYALLYGLLCVLFFMDIQVLPLYVDLNLLMIFSLASVYYWSIYHPRLLPAWLLFCMGVLKDLLTGIPFIGLSSLIFICVHVIVKQQRLYISGQSFLMIWAAYMLVCLFACFIFWIFLCLYLTKIASYQSYLIEGIIMVLAFPLVLSVTGAVHKLLPFASQDRGSL